MTTLRLPLEITQGSEFRRRFRAYGDTAKTLPIDFTDFSMQLICRTRQWIDAPEVFRCTIADGRIVNGGVDGYFDVIVSAIATQSMLDGDYYYWLTVWPTLDNTATSCWLRGPLKVLPGVEVV